MFRLEINTHTRKHPNSTSISRWNWVLPCCLPAMCAALQVNYDRETFPSATQQWPGKRGSKINGSCEDAIQRRSEKSLNQIVLILLAAERTVTLNVAPTHRPDDCLLVYMSADNSTKSWRCQTWANTSGDAMCDIGCRWSVFQERKKH